MFSLRAKKPSHAVLSQGQDAPTQAELNQNGLNRALRATQHSGAKVVSNVTARDIHKALSAIEATLYSIDHIRDVLEQACELVVAARDVEEFGGRAIIAERYDELRDAIDHHLEVAQNDGAILVAKGQRHMDVILGGKTYYAVSAMRLDTSERGLNLIPPLDAFCTQEEVEKIIEHLDNALARTDRAAAHYCRDAQYLVARLSPEDVPTEFAQDIPEAKHVLSGANQDEAVRLHA